MWRWLRVTVPLALALVLAGLGCESQGEPPPPGSRATLVVTQDFGREVVVSKSVELARSLSAMDMLKEVAEVEVGYGGGFVNAIDGISSHYSATCSDKDDWFLYINGISAKTGARDYTIHPDDIERWDFHYWGYRIFVPAIIGDVSTSAEKKMRTLEDRFIDAERPLDRYVAIEHGRHGQDSSVIGAELAFEHQGGRGDGEIASVDQFLLKLGLSTEYDLHQVPCLLLKIRQLPQILKGIAVQFLSLID